MALLRLGGGGGEGGLEFVPCWNQKLDIHPLYKAELENMLADDIIGEVTEPTDWVNAIECNARETPEGKKKVSLAWALMALNNNSCSSNSLGQCLCTKTDVLVPFAVSTTESKRFL